jgi:hypothetical protein
MIKVLIGPDGFRPRAIISTPEELRTGPGVAATTLIDEALIDEVLVEEALIEEAAPAKRPAISNTEIGPAASSNWKSGNMSTPIMFATMS